MRKLLVAFSLRSLCAADPSQPKDKAQILDAAQVGNASSARVYSLSVKNLDGQYALGNLAFKFTLDTGETGTVTPVLKPIPPGKTWASRNVVVFFGAADDVSQIRRFNVEVTSAAYYNNGLPGMGPSSWLWLRDLGSRWDNALRIASVALYEAAGVAEP